jgi:phosphatidylinositol 3-kinase
LTSEDKDLIWKFRFYLIRDKRGLTKFLKSVTWRDPIEVKQAVEELLPQWTELDMDDALELLGPGTVDSRVRGFAVRQLSRADDEVNDELYCRGNDTKQISGARALPPAIGASPQV